MNQWRFMTRKSIWTINDCQCRFVPNSDIWISHLTRIYWLKILCSVSYQTHQDLHKEKSDNNDIPNVVEENWLTSILCMDPFFHWKKDYSKNDFLIRPFCSYDCRQIQREPNSWNKNFNKHYFHIQFRMTFQCFDRIVNLTHDIWFRWGYRIINVVNCLA